MFVCRSLFYQAAPGGPRLFKSQIYLTLTKLIEIVLGLDKIKRNGAHFTVVDSLKHRDSRIALHQRCIVAALFSMLFPAPLGEEISLSAC